MIVPLIQNYIAETACHAIAEPYIKNKKIGLNDGCPCLKKIDLKHAKQFECYLHPQDPFTGYEWWQYCNNNTFRAF